MNHLPRLVLTPGEPAGIGPDICIMLAQKQFAAEIVVVANSDMLLARAKQLHLPLQLQEFNPDVRKKSHLPGKLNVIDVPLPEVVQPGQLNKSNASYVLKTLDKAIDGCMNGMFDAIVTGPVHKGIINDSGIKFTGHTEYLAERTGGSMPVMMLATPGLRVALVTTHLPLANVAENITTERLSRIIEVLHRELRKHFGISEPAIMVCGLNPHAGENGHLGREEVEIISPVLNSYREKGWNVQGPLPADTLFVPDKLKQVDAVLAMYHDQGLPVLKHMGFGRAVNVTLGLPIIRTSVDHGVALELAGSDKANPGSLKYAIEVAIEMVTRSAANEQK
jgi:4-hydroxythreonine-4-phosphate dehydrogenase